MISQQTLIYLNVAFLVLVVIYFYRGRAKDQTTKMNLGAKSQVGPQKLNVALRTQGPQHQAERELGVIFNFNGHQWEAYQVLGVPAGSSLDVCREACEKLKRHDDSEIFDLAIQAIQKSNT